MNVVNNPAVSRGSGARSVHQDNQVDPTLSEVLSTVVHAVDTLDTIVQRLPGRPDRARELLEDYLSILASEALSLIERWPS